MTDQRKSFFKGVVIVIVVGVELVLVPLLFGFGNRLNNLEKDAERINSVKTKVDDVERKVDHLLQLMEEAQRAQTQFYKDYAPALEYSKRQLEK